MTQNFKDIVRSDYIDTGLLDLLDRDLTALTAMSGESDPETPPEDAIYDNRTSGVIKLNGDVLIDYKNKLLNSTMLSNALQPLNLILTNISAGELEVPCVVCTDGSVYSLSSYGTTAINAQTIDGTKTLSKRSTVRSQHISNNSVTQEKLKTPLIEEGPFKCGDILYSCRSGGRSGFVRLGVGFTIGGASSGATYRSDAYFNLYTLLWSKENAVLRDISGTVVEKGNSALSDFGNGKSVDLSFADNAPFYHEVKFITPGIYTYKVPLAVTKLHIDCVGAAGGRGAFKYTPTSSIIISKASNGGRVECDLSVTPGDTIYVYVGGAGSSNYTESEYDAMPRDSAPEIIPGGFNGGGNGGKYKYANNWMVWAGSGGGMSDIRVGGSAIENQVVVAGGGGASVLKGLPPTTDDTYFGGAGGGLIGGTGENVGANPFATGGTQSSGGLGSGITNRDSSADGGRGFGGWSPIACVGGGAGYYGGGGGADMYFMGSLVLRGAGGGSSYTDPNLCTNVVHTQGYSGASGDGYVVITAGLAGVSENIYIKY